MTTYPMFTQSERKLKKVYLIKGDTSSGNYVSVGPWDSRKGLVEAFVRRYPRFKGYAEILAVMAEDIGNGVLIYNYAGADCMDSFESTKELKQYLGE